MARIDPYEQRLKQDMKKSDAQRKAEVSKLKSDIAKSVKSAPAKVSPAKKAPVPAMKKAVEKPMGLKSRRGLEDALGKKGLGGL